MGPGHENAHKVTSEEKENKQTFTQLYEIWQNVRSKEEQ